MTRYPPRKVVKTQNDPNVIDSPEQEPFPSQPYPTYEDSSKKNSLLPLAAGILLVIAGILGLLTWVAVLVVDPDIINTVLMNQAQELPIEATQIYTIMFTCGVIGLIFSVFVVLGGIFSLMRKMWWFALLGSIFGLFVIGTVFVSSILSFISLILIILSKEEFH